jgi:hypothetical protein
MPPTARPGAPGASVHDGKPDASLLNVYSLPAAALDVAVTDITAALAADPGRGRSGSGVKAWRAS